MNKNEFLAKLREFMSYELPERLVQKNLRFYSDYIDTEVQNGRNVKEVLEDLGDPQLIARTVIDAATCGADGIPNSADDQDFTEEIYGSGSSSHPGEQSFHEDGSSANETRSPFGGVNTAPGMHVYNMGCFGLVIIALVLLGVLCVIGWLIGFLSPVLAPAIMVLLIFWLIGNLGRRR